MLLSIPLFLLTAAVSSASPVKEDTTTVASPQYGTQCNFRGYGAINSAALNFCLNGYKNGNWNGENCGGRGWFKGGTFWRSPNDCYDACRGCVYDALHKGVNDVECEATAGLAECWMGYH